MTLCFLGGLLLIGYLAGQIGKGSESGWLLIIGFPSLISGVFLTLLFIILIRLDRIEKRLSASGNTSAGGER